MRNNAIRTIIISSVILIILVGILVAGLVGGGINMFNWFSSYSFSDSENYNVGNAVVDTNGITELNIDWIASSVKVETHSGNEIVISESNSDKLEQDEKLRYMVKNGVLHIKYWAPRRIFSFGWKFNKSKDLTVLIPESKSDLLKKLKIDTVSASQSISDISAEEFNFESVPGSIEADLKDEANKISAESVSGSIDIKAVTDSLDTESVSGRIFFTGKANKVDSNSVSGSSEMEFDTCPEKIDMESVSGKLTVYIPDNKGFTANYDSVSGNFNCEFATENSKKKAVYGDGSADFDFSTVSGSINLKKK